MDEHASDIGIENENESRHHTCALAHPLLDGGVVLRVLLAC